METKNPTTIEKAVRFMCDAELLIEAAAAGEAGAGEKKALPTFTMLGYTGAAVNVGYRFPVVFDLSSMKVRETVPIMLEHGRSYAKSVSQQVFGHTVAVENDGKRLRAKGVVSGIGADVDHVLALQKNGFPLQASVGLGGGNIVYVDEGETIELNGRKFKGPVLVAKNTQLREISVLPLGADGDTETRIAATAATENHMDEKKDEAGDGTLKAGGTTEAPKPKANPDPAPPRSADEIFAERAAAHELIASIEGIEGITPAICAQAIREKWSVDKTKLKVLEAGHAKGGIGAPNVIVRDTTATETALLAGVCLTLGMDEKLIKRPHKKGQKVTQLTDKDLEAGLRYEGIGLKELLRVCAQMEGKSVPSVFGDGEETMQASFSTVSLPSIMENVLNKVALASYEAAELVAPQLCKEESTTDFKEISRVRLLGTGNWDKVQETGELTHGKLDNQKFTNQLETYGQIIMLDRKIILSDDLGQLVYLSQQMGIAAAATIEDTFFKLLLSNPNNLFHAGNGNALTGPETNLGGSDPIGALSKARAAFRKIKVGPGTAAKDQKSVNIRPTILLVPVELETQADAIMTSAQVVVDGNTAGTKVASDNPLRNAFKVLSAPQLSDVAIHANATALAWWLFANPELVAAFQMLFLNNKRTPTIERVQSAPNFLGMGFRGYIDFAVKEQDPRGALLSKGAA
ncbi:MAG: hypothetical protein JNM94_16545 [Phycisphaerae bacterium]|nr:hypothetical protein [Phycisphaerae bacterium]